MSLQRRVLVGVVAVAVALVVTNAVLFNRVEQYLLRRVDRELGLVAREVSRPPRGGPGGRPPRFGGAPDADADVAVTEYFIAVGAVGGSTLRVVDSALYRDDVPLPRTAQVDLDAVTTSVGEGLRPFTLPAVRGAGEWRLASLARADGTVVVVGISLDEADAILRRIRGVQLLGTIAVLGALAAVSWWMVRLGVHPITDMAKAADEIAAGDLSRRVAHTDDRTEAGRLGNAFNSMLEAIQHAFRQREASEEKVRRFAADASHELRTPLTSIRGYAELYRAGGLRDEAALADAMRRIEGEAARMGGLVEDLLLLARLDQRRPLEQGRVRLDLIAADAVADARAVEPERSIELDTGPSVVVGDEMRLRQVVANLLANARVHTPPSAAVRVRVRSAGAVVVLEVADDGPGIAEADAAKVFERFYRADASRARSAGGTGLGLAIVAAVAEAHGGRADVITAPGRGARFVVELPAAADAEEPRTDLTGDPKVHH